MQKIAKAIVLLSILVSLSVFAGVRECVAQRNSALADYDYRSLAITSISDSAAEASKLSDIERRVKLLLHAADILGPSQPAEATRLLNVALASLKEWTSTDATWHQLHTANTLRNDVLAVYSRLDPERAASLAKESLRESETAKANGPASVTQNDWLRQLNDRRTIADQPATMALSLLDSDPEKAMRLAALSLQDGIVANALCDVVKKFVERGDRSLLNKLEVSIAQFLSQSVAVDPFSLPYACEIIQSDPLMPAAIRTAFVGFFMRSLQNFTNVLKGPGVNANYIRLMFTNFTLNVRPVILQYAPEQSIVFDLLLDQAAPFVSEQARTSLQAFQPEKFAVPRDRLAEILQDPNAQKRDLRLVRLIVELLAKQSDNAEENLELAGDAIRGITNPDYKAAFSDLLVITRVNSLAKRNKFIEAESVAGSISSEETRAWSLLALATIAARSDKVIGFELINNALKALDKASPSPQKVELAMTATAMLVKTDPQRAFDVLAIAAKYANSSPANVDAPSKPAVAFGLDAVIGDSHTKLGVFPENLADVRLEQSISSLGITDWFRAQQTLDNIHDPFLRLRLKLDFAAAVLTQPTKPKQTSPKLSAKS